MSYDLAFTVRPGSRAPKIAELKEWLAARPHWSVAEGGAGYANQATGASFHLYLRDNGPDDPPQRAPLDLTISGMGPHTLGLEAEEEVRALVERFGLLVDDPQLDGMGQGEFSGEKFLSGFEAYNRLAHRTAIQGLDQRPAVLPAEKLEAAWRWNRVRDALAERSGDELFVPGVLFAEGREPGTVETFVAWVEGIEARVPEVDAIQGALGRVAWSEIAPALELAQREETPLPHWLFQGEAVARVAEAIQRAPKAGRPPRLIPPREISTAELVAELLEPSGRDAAKEEAATQFQLAVSAHMRNDARAAFEAAVRAATGDPALQTACLLAAINGLYLARSEDALAWAERYLGPSPDDRTGHLLRGIALTDLARYDEAVEAIDRSLLGAYEAMNDNCRAYALAAGGRADEARAAYARALTAVEAALAEKPGDSELLARRSYSLAGLARFDEALAAAEQAIQADPGNFLALQDAARSAVELGRFRETIDYAQRASALREIAPEAAFFAARAHAALGEAEAARAALARATVTEHFRRKAAADPALAALLAPAKKPAAKKPAARKSAARKSAVRKPAVRKPATRKPAARKPAAKTAKQSSAKVRKKPTAKAAKATKGPAAKRPAAKGKKPARGAKKR